MKLWVVLVSAWVVSGCAVVQRVDTAFDCGAICNRYASCFDGSYDTSACASRCRERAANDERWRRKADTCNACISERACTAATFSCAVDCVGVVP